MSEYVLVGDAMVHLKHAPTIHNLKCGKRSIWDVASKSPDLANRTSTIFENLETEVVMETARRIVVAIDLSRNGSLIDIYNKLIIVYQ